MISGDSWKFRETWQVCKRCKPNHIIVAHDMGRAISATGKTKVGGNANFVLIRKVR